MSRVILKSYDNDEQHIVVGWDHPGGSFYWQEFNKEPDPDTMSGEVDWDAHKDWEEMLGYDGYMREYPTIQAFWRAAPPKVQDLLTHEVQELLLLHQKDPNSGRIIVDLSQKNPQEA
jgi:hypothetical protein